MRAGMRLFSPTSTAQVIVVRPAQGELLCAGTAMVDSPPSTPVESTGPDAALKMGKRYEDPESGLSVMCTKPGAGPLSFDGRELALQQSKPLPSSD